MKVTQSVVLEAPIGFCFDSLMRIEDAPKYLSIVRSLKMLTPAPIRVGSRWRENLIVFGRTLKLEATMTAVSPPNGYSFETTYRGVRMTMTFALEAQSPTRTKADLLLEGVATNMVGRLMLTAAAPFRSHIQAQATRELALLKREIEREHRENLRRLRAR